MILNQVNTGKACPRQVQSLIEALPDDSLMCYIKVHAFTLATVLDRLEALESFERKVLGMCRVLSPGAGKEGKKRPPIGYSQSDMPLSIRGDDRLEWAFNQGVRHAYRKTHKLLTKSENESNDN